MIPVLVNIPLAFSSVFIRRLFDVHAARLVVPVPQTYNPLLSVSTVVLCSGALAFLYHQLQKGTLVKIGLGRKYSTFMRKSRHTIQRIKPDSWFMRNLKSCRRKCAEALLKIAGVENTVLRNSSLNPAEIAARNISHTFSLPTINPRNSILKKYEPRVQKLYCNEDFCSNNNSSHNNIKIEEKFGLQNRPMTRNFIKSLTEARNFTEAAGDTRNIKSRKTARKQIAASIRQSSSSNNTNSHRNLHSSSLSSSKKPLEDVKKQIQKITRRTRSGKVYSYRL